MLIADQVLVDTVRAVAADMQHIEPMAARAALAACAEILERLGTYRTGPDQAVVADRALHRRIGRTPSQMTLQIERLAVGESVTMTIAGSPEEVAEFCKKVAAAVSNRQQRHREIRYSRQKVAGGYVVKRLA